MADKLEETFRSYADAARSKLQRRSEAPRGKGPLRLFVNKAAELRTVVDELENEPKFRQLVAETRSSFTEKLRQGDVKHFFRRSGYYIDIFEGKSLSVDATFHNYCEAFQRREMRVRYLLPMEFVEFAEPSMDFGAFQIRRFTAHELEAMFQNRVNEVFYPWAIIDVNRLEDYWFVCVTESSSLPEPSGWVFEEEGERVGVEYTRYPRAVESALQVVALFEWEDTHKLKQKERELWRGWNGFHVPFVLRADDNLLSSPSGAPDLSGLLRAPFFDPETGEEIGEERAIFFHFGKDETGSFKAFVQHTWDLLDSLKAKQNGWQFLEIALGFFIKAFFTEGLEQMLWHITVLEALLGESGEGLTDRLAGRIATILGETKKERKAIRKQFKDLYDFRSKLVHGGTFQEVVRIGHLREARNLTRRTLFWFLHFLGSIQAGIPPDQPAESIPKRKDILTLLDLDQNNRVRLGRLIDSLPAEFPYVQQWMK